MCAIEWSVKATDVAIVVATVAGPILAVWASEWRQQRRALHERKEWVFRTLWSTRSANLHPDHVQALNQIDFAFPEQAYPKIADAWHLYLAHLNESQGATEDSRHRWHDTASNLLADLIHLMASDLGVPFSKSLVKQRSYYPIAHALSAAQQEELRSLLIEVLRGDRAIPIHVPEAKT